MSDDKFDAIVVGAGVAGCVAAYVMANAGLNVLVIERGNFAGSKNMTGGRLYAHSLEKIMPGFAQQAPIERKVTHEKISFLTDDSAVTIDYQAEQHSSPMQQSYTVLRSKFDQWLMGQAEAAGAQFIAGILVDELVIKEGRVIGVKAGEDIIEASVTILAEGVNALLSQSIGKGLDSSPGNLAIGVKELIELPQQQLEDRFNLVNGEGTAWLFAGSPSNGLTGGGYLYTNQNSISLGIVCSLGEIEKSNKTVPQMLEDFKNHPTIRPLIQGGKLLEYSAHMVAEGGLNGVSELNGNGFLIIGDAAGLSLNLGFTIRGMDLAIASAEAAAQTVVMAKQKNDFSQTALSHYRTRLEESFVLKDMALYKKLPAQLENSRLFNQYPRMMADIMHDMFTINGQPAQPMLGKLLKQAKTVGLINLAKDIIKGVRAL